MLLLFDSKPRTTVFLVLLIGKALATKIHACLGTEDNGGIRSFSMTPSTLPAFRNVHFDKHLWCSEVFQQEQGLACRSLAQGAAQTARLRKPESKGAFPSRWKSLQPPCLTMAMLWDNPQSASAVPASPHPQPSCSSAAQLEWQLVPAHSPGAGCLPGTRSTGGYKPEQLSSCQRNTLAVSQLSWVTCRGLLKPCQCTSSPFSGPELRC